MGSAYAHAALAPWPDAMFEEVDLPRPARVLRVAPLPIRADRAAELRRIFGEEVEVTETSVATLSHVVAAARSIRADAVILDVVEPAVIGSLFDGLRLQTVLRPILDFVRTSRGERQPVFVGYGRVGLAGKIEPLTDGALRPGN